MNQRKLAYINGFEQVKRRARVSRKTTTLGAIKPSLYNRRGMPETNQIIQGDCIKVLNQGPEGWIDLVFADPPFNIGYLYHGYNDEQKTEDYLKFSEDWMSAVHRALKPTGSFYLAIGDEYAADLAVIARRQIGFHMRNWIIWHYTFGQQTKKMFAKSHTHILYFSKSKPSAGLENITFNADAVRVASARQTTYADARANPKGKLPDDTWYLRPQETTEEFFAPDSDTWNVSRVCGRSRSARAGTAARCRSRSSTASSRLRPIPAISSSTPSTAAAPPSSRRRCWIASTSGSISQRNMSTSPASVLSMRWPPRKRRENSPPSKTRSAKAAS